MNSKISTLETAIAEHVPDGASVVLGTGMEACIPFAAGHEIIRQHRRNLTLVGPISDILFDQLIGAGCVEKVIAAWVGNVSVGSAYNLRRAVEQSIPCPVEIEDHTNFTIALALHAAALGVPFLPAYSALGSDIQKRNPNLSEFTSPYTNETMVAVRAIHPDVAVISAQRADEFGNCHCWGNLGVTLDAVAASEKTLVVAEEIVSPEVIASDPNRTLIQGFSVAAVVHQPWNAHPSPVQGYYNRDDSFFTEYHEATRTAESNARWLDEWVHSVANREAYLEKLGRDRLQSLAVETHWFSAAADFGF